MKFIPFNINDYIKTKLDDQELQIWCDYKNQYSEFYPHIPLETIENLKLRKDKEGYYTFQMHGYMEIFGSHLNSISNSNVLIEVEG